MKAPPYVYFIRPVGLDGPIKIGCSGLPRKRLEELASWSPFALEIIGFVPGALKDESFIHQCFADTHSHHEWFHFTPALGSAIKAALETGSLDVLKERLAPRGSIRKGHLRRILHPVRRQYLSFSAKVRWAEKRLRTKGEDTAWRAPESIRSILSRWEGDWRRPPQIAAPPTQAEIDSLNEYLANPAAYSVIPPWRPRLIASNVRGAA